MRISDAVALSADSLKGNKLFLYTAKTGTAVYTVLPDSVVKALEATPHMTRKLYFWTGQGQLATAVKDCLYSATLLHSRSPFLVP